ncbi:hypothetical protein [Serratia fonticola]
MVDLRSVVGLLARRQRLEKRHCTLRAETQWRTLQALQWRAAATLANQQANERGASGPPYSSPSVGVSHSAFKAR